MQAAVPDPGLTVSDRPVAVRPEQLLEPRVRPAPVVVRIGMVDLHAVRRGENPPAGRRHAPQLAHGGARDPPRARAPACRARPGSCRPGPGWTRPCPRARRRRPSRPRRRTPPRTARRRGSRASGRSRRRAPSSGRGPGRRARLGLEPAGERLAHGPRRHAARRAPPLRLRPALMQRTAHLRCGRCGEPGRDPESGRRAGCRRRARSRSRAPRRAASRPGPPGAVPLGAQRGARGEPEGGEQHAARRTSPPTPMSDRACR